MKVSVKDGTLHWTCMVQYLAKFTMQVYGVVYATLLYIDTS